MPQDTSLVERSTISSTSSSSPTATATAKSKTSSFGEGGDQNKKIAQNERHHSPDTHKKRMKSPHSPFSFLSKKNVWPGQEEFLKAQGQIAVVIIIAWIGNNWEPSYNRNENHNMGLFWLMNFFLFVAAMISMKHDVNGSARGVQLLSRAQTEEWKGWMQWAFIMYHYYRAYSVYNVIRVFVSAYVWMTGFGNFLYFDKKQDFSIERAISMWLRINYFPLLLSFCLNISLENYYVVPLHTTGFFVTMATCYLASKLKLYGGKHFEDYWIRNGTAIGICLLVHIIFYETSAVNFLKLFSDEYHFRFKSDKYTAWVGILSGFFWTKFKKYMQWCYGEDVDSNRSGHDTTVDPPGTSATTNQQDDVEEQQKSTPQEPTGPQQKLPLPDKMKVVFEISKTNARVRAMWIQRVVGVFLIWFWWRMFGHIQDKYTYNPIHPYCFWLPVAGWLMIRNSSKYLTEVHSTALEFFGRITLETYVLQFHVFMNHNVKNIPVVIPGSDVDGNGILKFANMLFCGVGFVALAYVARKLTVTTQTTVTDLMFELRKKRAASSSSISKDGTASTTTSDMESEMKPMLKEKESAGSIQSE